MFLLVLGNFTKTLLPFTGLSKDKLAVGTLSIFSASTFILLAAYCAYLLRDLITNNRPLRENKEEWLLTASKGLTIVGVLCYQVGNYLPTHLQDFSKELNCNDKCVRRGLLSGVGLLLASLTIFTFIPGIFRKVNKVINEDFNEHFIQEEEFKDYRMQWLTVRMMAVTLDFDAVYTAVWIYTFVDYENCDIDDIIGSTACIMTGWFTWTVYAATYVCYLSNLRQTLDHLKAYRLVHVRYCMVNMLYYAALVLFLTGFFPIHIVAGNVEPLSCGCSTGNNDSLTIFTCEERQGVRETRLVLLFYQVIVVTALWALGIVKQNMPGQEYEKL